MGWPAVVGAVSAGVGALGSIFGGHDVETPPNPPDYDWISKQGPGMWNYLKGQGYDLNENPYGLGESKGAMNRIARGTSTAGYGAAQRNINQNFAVSGLSRGGGSYARQQYTAGRQYAGDLNRALAGVEIADFQAKEEQRNRGLNLLFSLSNKSPVYSQIAAQNYWNALSAANQSAAGTYQALGQTAQNMYGNYLQNQWMQQNPYNVGQGGGTYNPNQGQGGPVNDYGQLNQPGPYSGQNYA